MSFFISDREIWGFSSQDLWLKILTKCKCFSLHVVSHRTHEIISNQPQVHLRRKYIFLHWHKEMEILLMHYQVFLSNNKDFDLQIELNMPKKTPFCTLMSLSLLHRAIVKENLLHIVFLFSLKIFCIFAALQKNLSHTSHLII